MIVEKYLNNIKETTFKIQNSSIEAIRKKDITKKAVRVYKDGLIGVSGAIGDVEDDVLKASAIEHLKAGIKYPYGVTANNKESCVISKNTVNEDNIPEVAEQIVEYLKSKNSITFSEGVNLIEREVKISNTENLDLHYKDSYFEVGLIIKDNNKANLFDGFLEYKGRNFDFEKFKAFADEVCDKTLVEAKLPEVDRMPVMVLKGSGVVQKLVSELNGEIYGIGGSLLSGKMGEKVFNDKLKVHVDSDPLKSFRPFFDFEGCVIENNSHDLIKNGEFVAVYNNKKIADKFSQPHIGSATGDYDSVPMLGGASLSIVKDSDNLKDVIKSNGGYMIISLIASGGDFTSSGEYASPVQMAYLYDGENIIGKLPDFNIRSSFFNMFGNDYIGTFDSPLYFGDEEYGTVMIMDIDK